MTLLVCVLEASSCFYRFGTNCRSGVDELEHTIRCSLFYLPGKGVDRVLPLNRVWGRKKKKLGLGLGLELVTTGFGVFHCRTAILNREKR